MNDRLKDAISAKDKKEAALLTARNAFIVASIAAIATIGGALGTALFNFAFTERPRTEIAKEMKALQEVSVKISEAAQKTAQNVAATDAARLDTQRQLAQIEESRLKIQQQVAAIDQARFDLQREAGAMQSKNEGRRVDIEDARRKSDQIRLNSEITKAQNELNPNVEVYCNSQVAKITTQMTFTCTFKNLSQQRVDIARISTEVRDYAANKNIAGAIASIVGPDKNTIPVGITASNVYHITLSEEILKFKNLRVTFMFNATTDSIAVNRLLGSAKGYVDEKSVRESATQQYTFNVIY